MAQIELLRRLMSDDVECEDDNGDTYACKADSVNGRVFQRSQHEGNLVRADFSAVEGRMREILSSNDHLESIFRMDGDMLCKEPARLQVESEKISASLSKLAAENCSLFLASSAALNSLKHNFEYISSALHRVHDSVAPLEQRLKDFQQASDSLSTRHASLRQLKAMQSEFSELLALPISVDTCRKKKQHDEMLDLLMSFSERILTLRSRNCGDTNLLHILERQLGEQRQECMSAMLRQLGLETQFASTVKLVGHLRRLGCTDGNLREQFLLRRGAALTSRQRTIEKECRGNCYRGLSAATELVRTAVPDTAMQYRAIFGSADVRLPSWITRHVSWYLNLLQNHLFGGRGHRLRELTDFQFNPQAQIGDAKLILKTAGVHSAINGSDSGLPIDLTCLATLHRQAYNAASALRRVQAFFFPAAAPLFDSYALLFLKVQLSGIEKAFEVSVARYDYRPSAVYPSFLSGVSVNCYFGALPGLVYLLRHAPVSNLYNSTSSLLNTLLDCPIASTAFGFSALISKSLESSIKYLSRFRCSSVQCDRVAVQSEVELVKSEMLQMAQDSTVVIQKEVEFYIMCDVFADILLSALSIHLSKVLQTETHGFDRDGLRHLMVALELCSPSQTLQMAKSSTLLVSSAVAGQTLRSRSPSTKRTLAPQSAKTGPEIVG